MNIYVYETAQKTLMSNQRDLDASHIHSISSLLLQHTSGPCAKLATLVTQTCKTLQVNQVSRWRTMENAWNGSNHRGEKKNTKWTITLGIEGLEKGNQCNICWLLRKWMMMLVNDDVGEW